MMGKGEGGGGQEYAKKGGIEREKKDVVDERKRMNDRKRVDG